MALIDCPECGREISSSAAVCPECAYPQATGGAVAVTSSGDLGPARDPWWKAAVPILVRILIGGILIGTGLDDREVTGIIGGIIIGGSAIPTWYRYKIDRLRAGRTGSDLGARLEARLQEIANQQREQIAQLERNQSGLIAELEERVDFAERLLTKNRE